MRSRLPSNQRKAAQGTLKAQQHCTPRPATVRNALEHTRSGKHQDQQVHNRNDTHKRRDHAPPPPRVPVLAALAALAEPVRQQIIWELAHEPRTPTALAHVLGASQPLISKHLAILRAAGLVESHPDPNDRRSHVYDIRHEQLIALHAWLNDIQTAWAERRFAPNPRHYFEPPRPDPEFTTRGTARIRIPRALKEPWER